MKTYKELDVDFIGGAEPLTADEERAFSDFLKNIDNKHYIPQKRHSILRKVAAL